MAFKIKSKTHIVWRSVFFPLICLSFQPCVYQYLISCSLQEIIESDNLNSPASSLHDYPDSWAQHLKFVHIKLQLIKKN